MSEVTGEKLATKIAMICMFGEFKKALLRQRLEAGDTAEALRDLSELTLTECMWYFNMFNGFLMWLDGRELFTHVEEQEVS